MHSNKNQIIFRWLFDKELYDWLSDELKAKAMLSDG